MIRLDSPPCPQCGQTTEVEITDDEYRDFFENRWHIQQAMPGRTPAFRELLLSGSHDGCWMTMFAGFGAEDDFTEFLDRLFLMMLGNGLTTAQQYELQDLINSTQEG